MTEQERINLIKNASLVNQATTSKAVEGFIEDIKTEEVLGEHGLLDAQRFDVEDESSLLLHSPDAEDISEEEEEHMGIGISDQMRGIYS